VSGVTPTSGETSLGVGDGLVLLANDSMRARRRPGIILFVWIWEALVALVAAWPIAAVIHGAYGHHPAGDAPLWNPGGQEIIDLFQHIARGRPALGVGIAGTILISAFGGVIPLAALLTSMAYVTREPRAPRLRQLANRALAAAPALLVLLVIMLSVQGLVGGLGLAVAGALDSELSASFGEPRADLVVVALLLFVGLLVALLGVVHDLAQAAAVRFRGGAFGSLRSALGALRLAPFGTFWSWAWRALAAIVPVGVVALVAERLGGREGMALVVLVVLHQLTLLVRVALRASWLAKALRSVDALSGR
jgi:hypothetical protein